MSSDQVTYTYFHCGRRKRETKQLTAQSSIDEIQKEARFLCDTDLPTSYYFKFYNVISKQFVRLNQTVLNSADFNPYQLNSLMDNDEYGENIIKWVDFYVVDTTNKSYKNNTPSGILCNDTPTAAIKETASEQDLPVNNNTTDNDHCHRGDLFHALLTKDLPDIGRYSQSSSQSTNLLNTILLPDIDEPMDSHSTMSNNLSNEESLEDRNNPNQPNSNYNSSNDMEIESANLFNMLFVQEQPVQNYLINNDASPTIELIAGNTVPRQSGSTNETGNMNMSQPMTESNGTFNNKSNRVYFSLDVKPRQKNIYKSDQFNQKKTKPTNGYIARIQGIKTAAQNRSSVWPKIHIPRLFRTRRNIRLVVCVVLEQLIDGMRIWLIHCDKGFLPKGFTQTTLSINPIKFNLNECVLTSAGDLKLDLRMTTLWNKLAEPMELYRLDEQSTKRLHPAEHDPLSPRLFCYLEDDSGFFVDTICLSDFIRPTKLPKRKLANAAVTV